MAEERDLAGLLPPPPPPAPARREAAITAALRRFEGEEPLPAERRRRRRAWRLPAPQLGALVAASLALVIGVPLAMRNMDRWADRSPPAERAASAEVTTDKRAPPTASPELAVEATPGAEASAPRPPAASPTAPPAAPKPQTAARDEAPPAMAVAVPQPVVAAPAAAPPPTRAKPAAEPAAEAVPPPPPPPPSPPPPAAAASGFGAFKAMPARSRAGAAREESTTADIAATGAVRGFRIQGAPGAAEACTIDDPRRQLDACRGLVDPAAKGRGGRIAARIADGLSRAWHGDLAGATSAFDAAIAAAPSSLAYLNRGLTWRKRGDLGRALADLDRAVELAPGSAQAVYQRSRVLAQLGRAEAAAADRRRARELDPSYGGPGE